MRTVNKNVFFAADPHLHHANILTFKKDDGTPLRDFKTIDEMNVYIIEAYNSVVKPDDKLYILGDMVMKDSAWAHEILGEINGEKILIRGNHDRAKLSIYARYFKDVRSEITYRLANGQHVIFTHRPVVLHEDHKLVFNVHGHTHHKHLDDWRYYNLCPEVAGYVPYSWDYLHKVFMETLKQKGLLH